MRTRELNQKFQNQMIKIQRKDNEIKELNKVIEHKNALIQHKQTLLEKAKQNLEDIKDPTAVRDFGRLLTNFERDIDCIQHEKERQYQTMRMVCKIMENYGEEAEQEMIE